jgi:hypothetical protein
LCSAADKGGVVLQRKSNILPTKHSQGPQDKMPSRMKFAGSILH